MNLNTYLLLVDRIGILYIISLNLAIVKHNTFGNLLKVVSRHIAIEIDMIDLLLQELRMSQFRSQVAVIGKKKHTRRVAVKPADRIDAFWTGILHKIHHGLTLLRIITRRHVVLGLVKQHVDFLLKTYRLVMEMHHISTEHFGAQFRHHFSIDSHDTSLNEIVSLTSAADTSIGKELIQADRLVGVIVLLLIFYALLLTILGIGIIVGRTLTEPTLGTLAITSLRTLAVTTLRTLTIAALRTLAVTSLRTLAVTSLRTLAIAALRALTIAALRTLSIAATLLITLLVAFLIVTGAEPTLLLTRLIATALLITAITTIIICTRTITMLRSLSLQTGTKTFRTESTVIILIVLTEIRTFIPCWALSCVDAGTW